MKHLVVVSNGNIYQYNFDTMTEAYRFYVKNFATIGDWFYYLKTAHTLLNFVNREEIIECLFTHVFINACVITERG